MTSVPRVGVRASLLAAAVVVLSCAHGESRGPAGGIATAYLLLDGRARNTTEAIVWHHGEGRAARTAFVEMTRNERAALVAFLGTL